MKLLRTAVLCAVVVLALPTCVFAQAPTTLNDFFTPGTQPLSLVNDFRSAQWECAGCHGYYDAKKEPYRPWASSMMGQAARDPIFKACLTVSNQDAAFVGNLCLKCHAPQGHYRGHTDDPTGANLADTDFEGVACSVCHRAVNPSHVPGLDPLRDQGILALLAHPVPLATDGTPLSHNASLVIDPEDYRRGPFQLTLNPHYWLQSRYHRSGTLCGNCHDVSNPAYSKQPDGSYRLNDLDAAHPTGNKYDMFPVERTFSEWLQSEFAQGPVEMGGRFGGNITAVSTCQDCHMPRTAFYGCDPVMEPPLRPLLPQHHFAGANTWVLGAVRNLYEDWVTDLDAALVESSINRASEMLQRASDLDLTYDGGSSLNARITNQGGHKLPSGYPEGRAMWINVKFVNANGDVIREYGAYDAVTSRFSRDTKVYEAELGLDAYAAQVTGKPAGPGFHFALNNTYYLDNRIPPRGFTNAGFASVGAAPVNYTYADGQYWDDTAFPVPPAAVRADVRVYHQVTTTDYIEFLRDANTTNADGQIAYDQWVANGKSTPTVMDEVSIDFPSNCSVDFNGDGLFPDTADIDDLLNAYTSQAPSCDINADAVVSPADLQLFLLRFSGGACN